MKRVTADKFELPGLRSNLLPNLRQVLDAFVELKAAVGPLAEFHVVVDANILIRDVRWLTKGRSNLEAKTDLQECIIAGTIVAYVTPTVVGEVEEHLVRLAAKDGLPPDEFMAEWASYRELLNVREPDSIHVRRYIGGIDPDDAPTLALADTVSACGILSHDQDIKSMGGNVLSVKFILQARNYSRKAAVSMSIQIGGYVFIIGAVEALRLIAPVLRKGAAWFRDLPEAVKILTLAAMILAVLHPKSRDAIVAVIKSTRSGLSEAVTQIFQCIFLLANIAAENRPEIPALTAMAKA